MTAFISGFALGFSLILAIGAQNAFVLRQGIRGEHVTAVIVVCILSDIILIVAGVAGFGVIARAYPLFESVMRWGGAAFLIAYGCLACWRAISSESALVAGQSEGRDRNAVVLTAIALTWLNPHVYLDTVVLVGSVSAQFDPGQWWFALGAASASTVFFPILGYGAAALQPVFARPAAWRVLDGLVGLLMWTLAWYIITA